MDGIKDKVKFVRFRCDQKHKVPPWFEKYVTGYPTIILANPESYNNYYNSNGSYSSSCHLDGLVQGIVFNYIIVKGEYQYLGIPHTAENICDWVNNKYIDVLNGVDDENYTDYKIDTSFYA